MLRCCIHYLSRLYSTITHLFHGETFQTTTPCCWSSPWPTFWAGSPHLGLSCSWPPIMLWHQVSPTAPWSLISPAFVSLIRRKTPNLPCAPPFFWQAKRKELPAELFDDTFCLVLHYYPENIDVPGVSVRIGSSTNACYTLNNCARLLSYNEHFFSHKPSSSSLLSSWLPLGFTSPYNTSNINSINC